MDFNLFNKVKKGASWLFGTEEAHAFLTTDEAILYKKINWT